MTNAPITAGIGLAAVALLGLGAAPPTHAALPDAQRVTYGAFGTLGLIYHERDGIGYRRSVAQARGAESGELDYETNSLAGIQLNGTWNAELDAVVQVVTRLNARGNWQPQITRAALRYSIGKNLQLQAGLLGWELFPRAGSRHIGYSQLTLRLPVEVFAFIPSDRFRGAQLEWTRPLGAGLLKIDGYGGGFGGTAVRPDGSTRDIDGSAVWGGNLEYSVGAWALQARTGVLLLDELPDYGSLGPGLRQTGEPAAVALADTLANGDRSIETATVGMSYDSGPWQAQLLLGRSDIDNIAGPNIYIGSLVAGYRLGATTPYFAASFIRNQNERRRTGLPDTPEYATLNARAQAIQTPTRYNQHTVAAGLRVDVAAKLALKFQIDQVRLRDGTLHFDRRSGPRPHVDMTVFGLALDFVWWAS